MTRLRDELMGFAALYPSYGSCANSIGRIRVTGIELFGLWCSIALNDLCTTESKRRPIPGGVFILHGLVGWVERSETHHLAALSVCPGRS